VSPICTILFAMQIVRMHWQPIFVLLVFNWQPIPQTTVMLYWEGCLCTQILSLRTVSLILIYLAIWQDGYNYFTVARWFLHIPAWHLYKLAVLSCFWLLSYACGQSFHRNFSSLHLSFQNETVLCTTISIFKRTSYGCKTIVKDLMWI